MLLLGKGLFKFIAKLAAVVAFSLTLGHWLEWNQKSLQEHWSSLIGPRPDWPHNLSSQIKAPREGMAAKTEELLKSIQILKENEQKRQKELDLVTQVEP